MTTMEMISTITRLTRERDALVDLAARADAADGDLIRRLYAEVGEYVDRVATLTRERDAARAALRDASRCEECGAWATRYRHASAAYGCDSCGVGEGWADDTHAAALRAAMGAP